MFSASHPQAVEHLRTMTYGAFRRQAWAAGRREVRVRRGSLAVAALVLSAVCCMPPVHMCCSGSTTRVILQMRSRQTCISRHLAVLAPQLRQVRLHELLKCIIWLSQQLHPSLP